MIMPAGAQGEKQKEQEENCGKPFHSSVLPFGLVLQDCVFRFHYSSDHSVLQGRKEFFPSQV
jgi:hypothetical protein